MQDEPVAKRTRLDSGHRLNVAFAVGQTQNTNSIKHKTPTQSNTEETIHLDFTSQYKSILEDFLQSTKIRLFGYIDERSESCSAKTCYRNQPKAWV